MSSFPLSDYASPPLPMPHVLVLKTHPQSVPLPQTCVCVGGRITCCLTLSLALSHLSELIFKSTKSLWMHASVHPREYIRARPNKDVHHCAIVQTTLLKYDNKCIFNNASISSIVNNNKSNQNSWALILSIEEEKDHRARSQEVSESKTNVVIVYGQGPVWPCMHVRLAALARSLEGIDLSSKWILCIACALIVHLILAWWPVSRRFSVPYYCCPFVDSGVCFDQATSTVARTERFRGWFVRLFVVPSVQ